MFMSDLSTCPPSQIALLRAIAAGEKHLNAKDTVARYNLGTPQTITKNKKALVTKDIVEKRAGDLIFVDPVFELWFKREFL